MTCFASLTPIFISCGKNSLWFPKVSYFMFSVVCVYIYIWFYLTCLFIVLLLLNINSYGLIPTLEFSIESLGISDNHLFHIFLISVHSLQVYQPLLASVACNKTCHFAGPIPPNPWINKNQSWKAQQPFPKKQWNLELSTIYVPREHWSLGRIQPQEYLMTHQVIAFLYEPIFVKGSFVCLYFAWTPMRSRIIGPQRCSCHDPQNLT